MPLSPMSENFDINVDWEDVPESDVVPESLYELLITKAEAGFTRTDKLAVEITYEVGGGELEGSRLRPETLTLGNDNDPQGAHPETRRNLFGWMNLKRLCNAAGVRYEQSLRRTMEQLEGRRILGQVKVVTQPEKLRDGSANQYAGQQQNRITAYYPLGFSPGLVNRINGTSPQTSGGGNTPQPQRRKSALEQIYNTEEEGEVNE